MKIKSIKIIALALLFNYASAFAQNEPAKILEYGVGLNSLNSFSLQHRWGNENRIYRMTGTISGQSTNDEAKGSQTVSQDSIPSNTTLSNTESKIPVSFNVGGEFSILNLKKVTDKFGLFFGYSLGFDYSYSKNEVTNTFIGISNPGYNSTNFSKSENQNLSPNIGINLGGYYNVSPAFLIYAELAPNIYYGYSKSKSESKNSNNTSNIINTNSNDNTSNNFGISGLSNFGASLTFAYRIIK